MQFKIVRPSVEHKRWHVVAYDDWGDEQLGFVRFVRSRPDGKDDFDLIPTKQGAFRFNYREDAQDWIDRETGTVTPVRVSQRSRPKNWKNYSLEDNPQ